MKVLKDAVGYSSIYNIYNIKESLGKGGFGEVMLAEHKETGKKVALKVFKKSLLAVNDLQLCRNEIEALKLCQHPNILKLYDVLENSDYLIIAMELMRGGDLIDRIEKRKIKITEKIAAQIAMKIAKALIYMHDIGIIHRDIKPENILFVDDTPESDIKIADFGLASFVNANEKSEGSVGTLVYAAPEVILGMHYDKAVDLWGLGMITYMMLSDVRPFNCALPLEQIKKKIVSEVFDTSIGKWVGVSYEAKDFINSKLCTYNPHNRIAA